MIAINLLVPDDDKPLIDGKETSSFKIISSSQNRIIGMRMYIIETSEEEITFLTLKYGRDKVWKR